MGLHFLTGDATSPKTDGNKIIAHICNDIGSWGAGFVLAISRQWPEPEASYREWFATQSDFALGNIQTVAVSPNLYVANMIAQRGVRSKENMVPLKYAYLEKCLVKLCTFAQRHKASIHMPRIGCGLAGGKWTNVEPFILELLVNQGIDVFVYDLLEEA